ALLVTVTVAVRAAAKNDCGLKLAATVVEPPDATVSGVGGPEMPKSVVSPLRAMLLTVSGHVPVLEIVIVWGSTSPLHTGPKSIAGGVTAIVETTPLPLAMMSTAGAVGSLLLIRICACSSP